MLCISSAATDISAPSVPWPVPKSWDWETFRSPSSLPVQDCWKGLFVPCGATQLGLFSRVMPHTCLLQEAKIAWESHTP